MADMEMDDERQLDTVYPMAMPNKMRYPPGMTITLCQDELKKLDLSSDCNVGDAIHLNAMAFVTGVHKSDGHESVTLEIRYMAVEEEAAEVQGNKD